MKRQNPKHTKTGEQRCDSLSRAWGFARMVGDALREGEAPLTMGKFKSFMKSLDGAIRHAQRQRNEEEASLEKCN